MKFNILAVTLLIGGSFASLPVLPNAPTPAKLRSTDTDTSSFSSSNSGSEVLKLAVTCPAKAPRYCKKWKFCCKKSHVGCCKKGCCKKGSQYCGKDGHCYRRVS
ncbi:hypothetical protein FALBO_15690 [Fusarium albosuccineum]|uniref:Uncharacterized protein n=1 Tax=Fusarium albosuccineum TaxID=1237068 RepID=A0A8H4KT41_9HYPO|nr:hypothetical protein FALBO_15690 [Fusarium albosuccineum]